MHPHISLLVNHAIEYSGRFSAQSGESISHRSARLIDRHECIPIHRQPESFWQLDRNHCPLITAVFTHTTGGSPSASSRHVAPSSIEPNNFPLRVPK